MQISLKDFKTARRVPVEEAPYGSTEPGVAHYFVEVHTVCSFLLLG